MGETDRKVLELDGELEMEVEASDGAVRPVESDLSLPLMIWYWCGDISVDLDHVEKGSIAGTGLVVEEVDPTCVLAVEASSVKKGKKTNRAISASRIQGAPSSHLDKYYNTDCRRSRTQILLAWRVIITNETVLDIKGTKPTYLLLLYFAC